MSAGARSILVVGIPRSGSTWIGNVLGRAAGGELVHEPDNEKEQLGALLAKSGLGRFPVLTPGDSVPAYEQLWRAALTGATAHASPGRRARMAVSVWRGVPVADREAAVRGRRTMRIRLATRLAGSPAESPAESADRRLDGWATQHETKPIAAAPTVAKSVHVTLAVDWLADLFPTTQVVLVVRHPANVLASWLEMKLADRDRALDVSPAVHDHYLTRWGVQPPAADADGVARAAWQACLLTAATLDVAARRPEMVLVSHDELCVDPATSFPCLAGSLGLPWPAQAQRFVLASDRPGDGFVVQRRAADQPDRWRTRLAPTEVRALTGAAEQFPGLDRWLHELRAPASRAGQG